MVKLPQVLKTHTRCSQFHNTQVKKKKRWEPRRVPYRAVTRGVAQPAGRELPRIARPAPHRARERVLRGRRRGVCDRRAAEVVRELDGAGAVPRCAARGRAERALERREVVRRALSIFFQYFFFRRRFVSPTLWCRIITDMWRSSALGCGGRS